jgi:hypothetical protein
MTPHDTYVRNVLLRHQSSSNLLVAQNLINTLSGSINLWANGHLQGVSPSGSVAKGTAISGISDVDILISVKSTATETLKEVYEKLYNRFIADGYNPRKQNVSLGLTLGNWKVDVVPAKLQSAWTTEHSLWSHKSQARRSTNIHKHIQVVTSSLRTNEIKLLKIWKKLHQLEFPSFPLEVTVITALKGRSYVSTAANFVTVLEYLRDSFLSASIIDPTKPSNILTDELTVAEKTAISNAARNSFGRDWEQVLW